MSHLCRSSSEERCNFDSHLRAWQFLASMACSRGHPRNTDDLLYPRLQPVIGPSSLHNFRVSLFFYFTYVYTLEHIRNDIFHTYVLNYRCTLLGQFVNVDHLCRGVSPEKSRGPHYRPVQASLGQRWPLECLDAHHQSILSDHRIHDRTSRFHSSTLTDLLSAVRVKFSRSYQRYRFSSSSSSYFFLTFYSFAREPGNL